MEAAGHSPGLVPLPRAVSEVPQVLGLPHRKGGMTLLREEERTGQGVGNASEALPSSQE